MNTNEIGARTEGVVLAALLKAGYAVLVPFGTLRYDLAIDTGQAIKRIQCKTGRLIKDGTLISFATSSNWPDGRRKIDYRGHADFFGVYCHGTGDCYLVPVEETGMREAYLRLVPPRGRGINECRMAADYLIKGD